ncbi:MAG: cyclic beta 1-2 glucan synthetase [Pseudomonadota bacterium]|nr:cyclic beta 1-2 glucan synthetase [Pseudomonadota bacterium]
MFRTPLPRILSGSSTPSSNRQGDDQTPLRAELFSADQMEVHGRTLARSHTLSRLAPQNRLLGRLDENEQVLIDACNALTVAVRSKLRIAPAGEWLLDNFYLIEEQIRTARRHLPRGYSRGLPRLAQGPSRGLPRSYDIALEAISHGDGRVDAETLSRFVAAYQTVEPLTLGELWAIPIMLRLALIENLRRVSVRITAARAYSDAAQQWADQMTEVAESDPKNLILVIADMARSDPPLVSSFVAELARRLQGHGLALALPLTWIEQRLAESSQTIEQMVLAETQNQAADQVSISNSIGSLRFLGAMDWREFVELLSHVEQTLRDDPNETYDRMDFGTRDRYRHVVARLAKRSPRTEIEVAQEAIGLARRSAAELGNGHHTAHVGYYLVDRGLPQLESALAYRLSWPDLQRRRASEHPLALYLGTMLILTVVFGGILLANLEAARLAGWRLEWLGAIALLGASQLASSLTNWLATLLATPRLLPRLDFSAGLPSDMRAMVVIPTLLNSTDRVDELVEALEVRYLGNRDPQLRFGLLTDFCDAPDESLADDARLLSHAQAGIERLNSKYAETGPSPFYLLHRPRRWNPAERCWMGHERKRGKLADLNLLLRGEGQERFSLVVGDMAGLQGIRYVITLDADTELPRDSARQLIGVMAHTLNCPRYDESRQRVTGGYGILQPRMAASLAGANRSRYAQLFGSEPGIDPYTRSVSDVYQDLFSEGSFIGKGIYEVDAFESALKSRFPENWILSHDLLEGCYARSGLLSDVMLYEEYPSRYDADTRRHERWIRGDWQIARWLMPRVPGPDRRTLRNPLSALSRWKIFDNLRRSLTPAALTILFPVGWYLAPDPVHWTIAVAAIFVIPLLLVFFASALRKTRDLGYTQHLLAVSRDAGRGLAQTAFRLATLPHEAVVSLGAVVRTSGRMLITRRNLLEWSPYDEQAGNQDTDLATTYRALWPAPFIAAATAFGLVVLRPEALLAALPLLGLWLAAPALASWLSRPLVRDQARLSAEQTLFLRKIARKTWAFFDRFVGDGDHWLPPDNFQEDPGPVIAHRTSPTNIGMMLLANLSAYDFGYIPAGNLLTRTDATFRTMAGLVRYRGHFFNWYDTRTLLPLPPRYVSSVDSGNLAGLLLTLRAGLLALPDEPVVGPRTFGGLADTLALLAEALPDGEWPALDRVHALLQPVHATQPHGLAAVLLRLETLAVAIAILAHTVDEAMAPAAHEWAAALGRQCTAARDELMELAPWLHSADAEADAGPPGRDTGVPTLRELAAWNASPAAAVARQRVAECERLAQQATGFADFDYEFLYDRTRHLLAIGYNVDEFRRDTGYYDLLASESRLSNFVGIAQGQLPQECWFALGRMLTTVDGETVLVSWSGSMFEYLMPLLVMPTYEGTLLDQTCRAAVARQIAYGRQRSQPWGISESGYNTVDANLNYQYHAFGVPGLGLTRGLAEDLVVAPYASALALIVAPEAACANLQRLSAAGLEGQFGFYEAIDYTPARLARGQTSAIVRSFMAHHQGMCLLALAHRLLDRPMQRRFESDPQFQATLLLLQEKIPKTAAVHAHITAQSEVGAFSDMADKAAQLPIGPDTPSPEVQLLSNGRYHVMVTNAGGGYSRWREFAVTRWREDPTSDNWGSFFFLRDAATGEYWSATQQPTLRQADSYEAMFSEGRVEFRRRDLDYETYSEIVVSPEDDIELRRIRVTNHARVRRTVEITSYAELVLAAPAADALQPSFGNLFIQTEIVRERRTILSTRRPRSARDPAPWAFHQLATHGAAIDNVSYETDRVRFIGRGRTIAAPQALSGPGELSGSEGSVLEPVAAIRCEITLAPGQSATLDFISGAADNRETCLALIDRYRDRYLADRVFDLAWTHSGVMLRQINATPGDAQIFGRLAGFVLYANPALRADADVMMRNQRGQAGLWGYAISGDLPIVLLKVSDGANVDLARQLIRCHSYWRLKGLVVDLVIWNEDHVGYRQRLQDQIMGLIATGIEASSIDRPGGIFVRYADQISIEDRTLLQAAARIIISDRRGTLAEQVGRRKLADRSVARLATTRTHRPEPPAPPQPQRPELILGNPLGGFSADGREYVITTTQSAMTPVPWVNVIANPGFGTVLSESGLAYTWFENAHEYRLTPWSGDPVGATGGEAIYLRDEESGHYWSPAPQPCSGAMPYVTRHGFGYSVFEHTAGGIHTELWIYVDLELAVKYSVLKVKNGCGRARQLTATGYVEWVLGDLRSKSAMHVITEIDPTSGALLARNAYNSEFSGRVAFFDVDDMSRALTGDRTEFIGRNRTFREPDAMTRSRLSGRLGAALDPCGAIQVPFELADGEEREIIFRLGAGRDVEEARRLALRLRKTGTARNALGRVQQYWQRTLGTVQVETPDPSLNVLCNGWLPYQVQACRLWARSGYSQSGGAYGFRDQLQDAMALVHAEPRLVREHLLRCAGQQFPEGDVLHWWHPPAGRGVRTRCSDDYLWLPLAVCRYVECTGDATILDERIHFLEGRGLGADEESYYDLPGRAREAASVYQHCVRAIQHGLRFGRHGLPLMGSGDWNDGMNLVGIHGKGESVWLGFFLHKVLVSFAAIALRHDDAPFAERCHSQAADLRRNIAKHAWDGEWYLRAWFDDGQPLGSILNTECSIDSISQSWSVLSGAGEPARSRLALDALERRLVEREQGLVRLLDPPFDTSELDPGYIKGYVPGVRENGGQYTHAAVWAAMAFAQLGDSRRAFELLSHINPVNHARTPETVATYKAEPYVVAADVYAVAPHVGRGGWTWYTGSAGWLYRLIVESLLGLRRDSDRLHVAPCMPADWTSYAISYRYGETRYRIVVEKRASVDDAGSCQVLVDGIDVGADGIPLVDDQQEHNVTVGFRPARGVDGVRPP